MQKLFLLLVFITICISITIYIAFHSSHQKATWSEPNKVHLTNIIEQSYFFEKLNALDLKARNATSNAHYKSLYKQHIYTFSKEEKSVLTDLITTLNNTHLYKYPNIYRIPWLIAKTKDIENNFPHTLGDIIFLPEAFFKSPSIETLLHEKIHIYQRFFPIETRKLLSTLGFHIYDVQKSIPTIRTNPDTDDFIYMYQNTVQAQTYQTDNPKDITESSITLLKGSKQWEGFPEVVKQRDHPYEIMACWLAHAIIRKTNQNDALTSWMKEFL
jgi:hypothetical protein